MKRVFRQIPGVALPILFLFITSCSRKSVDCDTAVKRIAADKIPASLASVKLKVIMDKGGISNFENVPLMVRPFLGDKMSFFQGSTTTGLDLSKKMYILAYPGESMEPEIVMLATVVDANKVRTFLSDQFEMESDEHDGFNYVHGDVLYAWDDKLMMAITGESSEEKLLQRASALFKTAADEKSGNKLPRAYADVLADDKSDFVMGVSHEHAADMQGEMLPDKKIGEFVKDYYSVFSWSFLPGKITATGKNYFGNKETPVTGFLSDNGLPESFKKYMGIDPPYGAMSVNMNFGDIYNHMLSFVPDVLAGPVQDQLGLDLHKGDLLKHTIGGFGNHFMVSVSRGVPRLLSETSSDRHFSYTPTLIGVMEIKGEFMRAVIDSMFASGRKDGYYEITADSSRNKSFLMFTGENELVFTNNTEVIKILREGKGLPAGAPDYSGDMFTRPVAGFVDFTALAEDIKGLDKMYGELAKDYRSVTFSGDTHSFKLELICRDKEKNGLWTVFHSGKELATKMFGKLFF